MKNPLNAKNILFRPEPEPLHISTQLAYAVVSAAEELLRSGKIAQEEIAIQKAIQKTEHLEWQKISFAPKDGTLLLLTESSTNARKIFIGFFSQPYNGWRNVTTNQYSSMVKNPILFARLFRLPGPIKIEGRHKNDPRGQTLK
jgi:hypothetical protein